MPLRDVAVAGVYVTRQARSIDDVSAFDLTWEAVTGCLADAGLETTDVDGAAIGWTGPGGGPGDAGSWARIFGHPLHFIADGLLDTAGARGVLKGASAIAMGLCDVVVVGGASASGNKVPGGGSPGWKPRTSGTSGGGPIGGGSPWGNYVAADFALVAQRHMYEFGTTSEQLAEVAATIRNNGHVNPEAVMFGRGPYTVDDVLDSRPVALPLHLLDICLVAQGGAAVVLTSTDRARDLRHPVTAILGGGMEFNRAAWTGGSVYAECGMIGADAARRMYGMAGVRPEDTDMFSMYDPTSFEIIRQFEMLGLCAAGEGGPFVQGGAIEIGGKHPTNPEGGCLSHSWNGTQQMTLKIVECVRQLRGQAGDRQVADCEVALATNAGSGAQHIEMALLGTIS